MLKLPLPPSSPEHTWLLSFCPFTQVASSLVHMFKHRPFYHLHQQKVSGMSTLTLESVWLSLWSVLSCPHSLGGPSVTTWKAAAELIPRSARHPGPIARMLCALLPAGGGGPMESCSPSSEG